MRRFHGTIAQHLTVLLEKALEIHSTGFVIPIRMIPGLPRKIPDRQNSTGFMMTFFRLASHQPLRKQGNLVFQEDMGKEKHPVFSNLSHPHPLITFRAKNRISSTRLGPQCRNKK